MKKIQRTTFTQLRNNAKKFFDAVEKGQSIEVYRKGRLVALLSPVADEDDSYWQNIRPLRLAKGASLSKALADEREEIN